MWICCCLFGFSGRCWGSGLCGALRLQDLGDDLLLLDEKGSDNAISHTTGAFGATIWASDSLSTVRKSGEVSRSSVSNASQFQLAVSALGHGTVLLGVQVYQTTTGRLGTKVEWKSRVLVTESQIAPCDTVSQRTCLRNTVRNRAVKRKLTSFDG